MKTTSQAAKSGTPESAVLCVSRWNSAPMVAAPATATKPLNISFPIEARCQSGDEAFVALCEGSSVQGSSQTGLTAKHLPNNVTGKQLSPASYFLIATQSSRA